ncbi:MAG: amidohydrolase [Clostridiales bacterium]|nr:amidohydrolase [Clostridiales bacterium]
MKVDLIISNIYVVTMDGDRKVIRRGYIAIADGVIKAVGEGECPGDIQADRVIDGQGKAAFPGLVDTHMHMFQTMFKGLGRDLRLFDWLDSTIRPSLHRLDPEICYYAALLGCMESIHSGCTTILDYMYAHAVPGTNEGVVRAMNDIGIRGILGSGKINAEAFPPEFNVSYFESEQIYFDNLLKLHNELKDNDRVDVCMAPGIIFDITDDCFREMRKVADETGMLITMHLNETIDDDEYCIQVKGKKCTEFLDDLGVLGPDFIAVHTVLTDDTDLHYFKKNDVKISHNPVSNMILGNGAAPIIRMQEEGLTISLACDGAASNDSQDMIEVLKTTALLQKAAHKDPAVMPAQTVLEFATLGGAKAIGKEAQIGSIEVGKRADLFLYDPMYHRSVPVYDPVSSLVYCSSPNNVDTVIINGKVIMENKVITTIDEERVMAKVQENANELASVLGLGNNQWGVRTPNLF